MKFSDMPVRDFYALEVLKGIVARGEAHSTTQVSQAYGVADALLKFQKREIDELTDMRKRAEKAETEVSVLLNMNGDGQFAPRAALSQIWGLLRVDNQTSAVARINDLLGLH